MNVDNLPSVRFSELQVILFSSRKVEMKHRLQPVNVELLWLISEVKLMVRADATFRLPLGKFGCHMIRVLLCTRVSARTGT